MDYTRRRLLTIPGARFREGAFYRFPITAEQKAAVRDPQDLGIPTLETFSIGARSNFAPATRGHLGFSPVIPMTRRGRHRVAARVPARAAGVRHGRRAARVPAVLSSAHVRDPLHVLCDARSCLEPGRAPHVRAARRSRGGARLGRVPHAHGLHGPVRGARTRSTITRCASCKRRSRTPSIRTASCRRAATAFGRSTCATSESWSANDAKVLDDCGRRVAGGIAVRGGSSRPIWRASGRRDGRYVFSFDRVGEAWTGAVVEARDGPRVQARRHRRRRRARLVLRRARRGMGRGSAGQRRPRVPQYREPGR